MSQSSAEYHRQYRLKNKTKISEAKKNSYNKNKQHYLVKAAEYRKENPEIMKEWKARNRGHIRAYNNHYITDRCKIDPMFKLKCTLRKMLCKATANAGYTKKSRTEDILGCSFKIFQQHIQDKFLPNMHWNNHGKWHIDHIIPLSTATTEEELIKLNHYTNLQPLWAKDNLIKGAKIYAIHP